MMTVRFPNGQAIQYNTATFAFRSAQGYTDLYTKKGGDWIAQVPTNACVIETAPACQIRNPLTAARDEKIEALAREIRLLKRKIVKK